MVNGILDLWNISVWTWSQLRIHSLIIFLLAKDVFFLCVRRKKLCFVTISLTIPHSQLTCKFNFVYVIKTCESLDFNSSLKIKYSFLFSLFYTWKRQWWILLCWWSHYDYHHHNNGNFIYHHHHHHHHHHYHHCTVIMIIIFIIIIHLQRKWCLHGMLPSSTRHQRHWQCGGQTSL